MSYPNLCERCGGPLPEAGPLGRACPRCMMELGVESTSGNLEDPDSTLAPSQQDSRDPAISARPTAIGRYRILRLIGEGGMGAVYEAEQDLPRRIVALKIIKPGIASPELLRRFEQESHALGRLQHPGIAQIHEAGTADTGFGPQPYFAMEFIRGKTLKEYAEGQHLNARQRLEMVSKIAEAVQHAHQRGLIHRDLKPVNIMVDETGQPKILDFGVARATDSDAQATSQTDMGQLVGTLAYMSPEQVLADPLELDTRSDVYSLGVILYELLAGKLPYSVSKKLPETIQAIREEDPAKLSAVSRTYRGDIETIVAKALEKDKSRRYTSAAELSADIQRYLKDEPIVARPPSTTYQLQKFARRYKALVVGAAAVFVVLVGGIVASTSQMMRANRERQNADAARQDASGRAESEARQRVLAEGATRAEAQARAQSEAQTLVAQQALGAAQVNLYFNNIALADREWAASNFGNADRLLDEAPTPLRNWEWNYLTRLNHMEDAVLAGHRDAILALAMAPDGKRLRTFSDGTFKDWDIETGKETATGTFGATGATARISLAPMLVSDNGRMLHWKSYFWDLLTGKDAFSFPAVPPGQGLPAGAVVALSPDGMRVVAPYLPERIVDERLGRGLFELRTWDIGTGRELGALGEYAGDTPRLTISPDGARLAVVQNRSTRIINATTGKEVVTLAQSEGILSNHLAFSRDGATVAARVSGGVRVWKTGDGQELWPFSSGTATQIAFDPDGRLLAAALADRTIRILDSATGREDIRLAGHTGTIRALSFTPDGTRLVSAGDDKLVHVWSVRAVAPNRAIDTRLTGVPEYVRVSPDGRRLLIKTESRLRSWDLNTGQAGFEIPGLRDTLLEGDLNLDFSENGARIVLEDSIVTPVAGGQATNSYLKILDAHSGSEIAEFHRPLKETLTIADRSPFQAALDAVRISPDGNRAVLVVAQLPDQQKTARSRIYIWDIPRKQLITSLELDKEVVPENFSPNGKLLAVRAFDSVEISSVETYDSTTGRRVFRLDGAESLVFSPDGNRLASANGRTITIWDARTGAKLVPLPEARNNVLSMAFNPDGTRLVSFSDDGDVQLWDVALGRALIHLSESSGPYSVREVTVIHEVDPGERAALVPFSQSSFSFSPDGRKITLTTVSPDPKGSIVRIATWDGTPRHP